MGKKLILIVDDDQGIRDAVHELLEMEGFEVEVAASGAEGLASLRRRRPDLVLLDFRMPGMDGLEFRSRQQEENLRLDVPVVLMSAEARLEEKQRQAGITDCLRKPMDILQLLETVRKHCS